MAGRSHNGHGPTLFFQMLLDHIMERQAEANGTCFIADVHMLVGNELTTLDPRGNQFSHSIEGAGACILQMSEVISLFIDDRIANTADVEEIPVHRFGISFCSRALRGVWRQPH